MLHWCIKLRDAVHAMVWSCQAVTGCGASTHQRHWELWADMAVKVAKMLRLT